MCALAAVVAVVIAVGRRLGRSEAISSGAEAEAADRGPSVLPTKFSPEIGAERRVGFANLVKSLYAQNAEAFLYWRRELLTPPVNDAVDYAARMLDAVHAQWVMHYVCVFRSLKPFNALPPSVWAALEEATAAVEALLAYDCLPSFPKVQCPPTISIPDDPLDRLELISKWMQEGIDGPENHQELWWLADKGLLPAALRGTMVNVSWVGPAVTGEEAPPVDFPRLAATFALLYRTERAQRSHAQRWSRLAVECAAQVRRDDVLVANVVASFRDAGLSVPGYTPKTVGEYSVRVSHDGGIVVVPQSSSPDVVAGPQAAPPPLPTTTRSEAQVLRGIEKSLHGLVGLDRFKQLLAMDLYEFHSAGQSRGRVFWGPSGVGKTEVAQRLSGLREGFPGLAASAGATRYVSGVDGKLEVKEIVDGLPPLSILFIDEADKCLDHRAGMVSPAEATQVRHAIVTHFQRKPILWVFLGVFSQMRAEGGLTDEALRVNFGDELAHRLDFADWGFPAWTLENLLKAVNGASSRRKLRYDDRAALALAEYCIKTGGGVRAFDNLETAIVRHMRVSGIAETTTVSLAVAREIMLRRGVRTDRQEA